MNYHQKILQLHKHEKLMMLMLPQSYLYMQKVYFTLDGCIYMNIAGLVIYILSY